ncbi:malonyl-CoA decarboxylase-domain-containing protein [Gongronella butleri]|nr:malonyl-CoA decarboxylase-domain-containing protein [Gongronella butleri]
MSRQNRRTGQKAPAFSRASAHRAVRDPQFMQHCVQHCFAEPGKHSAPWTMRTLDLLAALEKHDQLVFLDHLGDHGVSAWLAQVETLPDHLLRMIQLRCSMLDLAHAYPAHPVVTWTEFLSTRLKQQLVHVQCQSLDTHSPTPLLEKIVRFETVHAVASERDLERRLASDRRVFALIHAQFPLEPLAFVHVALTNQSPTSVQSILQQPHTRTPVVPSHAICYSINTRPGMGGMQIAHQLINQVVQELASAHPSIHTFATLSPIPGFTRWLAKQAPGTLDRLNLGPDNLLERLDASDRANLLQLCARYLLLERRGNALHALDPVAHFHLRNGANIQQLHFLADSSEKGIRESLGMMVNYQYIPSRLEEHQRQYRHGGTIFARPEVEPSIHHPQLTRVDG